MLAEAHNREELQRVLQLDHCLIGINNRNLHDFVTHIQTTVSLLPLIPVGRTVVSESGICEPSQVNRLYTRGGCGLSGWRGPAGNGRTGPVPAAPVPPTLTGASPMPCAGLCPDTRPVRV